jgi:hypothetical protein
MLSREPFIRTSRSNVRPIALTAYVRASRRRTCQCKQRPYETVISLRTGRPRGPGVPPTLLGRADKLMNRPLLLRST